MALRLSSDAFADMSPIPVRHTCDGDDVSPPLAWSGLPEEAKSLALVIDDPDVPDPAAPVQTWVHWIVYNLPPDCTGLPDGASRGELPAGALEGSNDWHRNSYGGPCPPPGRGRHRYFFRLYVLDIVLDGLNRPTRAKLERAMRGHILAEAQIIGTYERPAPPAG